MELLVRWAICEQQNGFKTYGQYTPVNVVDVSRLLLAMQMHLFGSTSVPKSGHSNNRDTYLQIKVGLGTKISISRMPQSTPYGLYEWVEGLNVSALATERYYVCAFYYGYFLDLLQLLRNTSPSLLGSGVIKR